MRRLAGAAALVAVGLVGGAAGSHAMSTNRPAAIAPAQVEVIACHIEWDAQARAPRLDRGSGSGCSGVWGTHVDARGRVVVDHASDPVISIEVTPDEAAVARGISAGPSGGGNTTKLTVHDSRVRRALDLSSRSDASRLGGGSGWWLVITHDSR
ncbi:hypothetical protein [Janibacter terrae]|uniref:hypothetical protein n=1 Tax=Janibacter terrae TaxID=103817 RepID=UPI00082CD95B|nr:hypothetical protein [Janibacter terrae]